MAYPKVFTAKDFIEPICLGPMKGLPQRIALRANEVLYKREVALIKNLSLTANNSKLSRELLLLGVKLNGLGFLLENQNEGGVCPDTEIYWGIALIMQDMSRKLRRIGRALELAQDIKDRRKALDAQRNN